MATSRRVLPLFGLIPALLLGGCNLFQPRTPEPPSSGGIVADYSSRDATLQTMKRAIEAKAAGNSTAAYLGALADSIVVGDAMNFIAWFDPQAVAVSGKVPPKEWGPSNENLLFVYLPELSSSPYTFDWVQDEQHPNDDDPAPGVVIVHKQYVLTSTPESGSAPQILAIGYADLTFIQSKNGHWVISRWNDRVDPAVGPNPSSGKQSFSALRLSQAP